jgi:TonB-dependent starch-binding outer membrane protein SusC
MKKNILALFFTFICLLFVNAAFGQDIIRGTIVDSTGGTPIIGVTVILKGTDIGTISDIDGKFIIEGSVGSTLVIVYAGFQSREVFVDRMDLGEISLEDDHNLIEEDIFITCAPCQNKFKSNGSINIIKSDNFNQGNIWDPAMLIQGKVPGLSIYNKGGNPNSLSTMRLRGIYTMGAYVGPLIVIDDVVGASLENIDPQDIASFEVLKDGSSAAIYGMRGTAGVIKIKTKQASGNSPTLSYNGQVGMSTSLGPINILNADQFLAVGGTDLGSRTDWIKEISRNGIVYNHNVAAQVNKNNTSARFSANLRNTQGTLKTTGFEKINLRGNFNTKLLKEKININLNGSWTNRNSNIGFEDAFYYAQSQNPTTPIFASEGKFPVNPIQFGGYYENFGLFNSFNPISMLQQNRKVGKQNLLNYNSHISYNFTQALAFNINYAHENTDNDIRAIYLPTSHYKGGATSINRKGLSEKIDINRKFSLLESYAHYKKDIKSVNLDLTAGYAYQNTNVAGESLSLANFNATTDIFNNLFNTPIDAKESKLVRQNLPDDKLISFYSTAKISFNQDAIVVNASLRRDGSSRLGENNQWGNFPALGTSIDFAKYINNGTLNTLRLRLGYGITGMTPSSVGMSNELGDTINVNGTPTYRRRRAANPDLKWETKRETNIGIDLAVGKLTFSTDVFNRNIDDLITLVLPDNTDFPPQNTNNGAINTRGIEFSLNYILVNKRKFKYTTGIIYSTSKSIVKDHKYDYLIGNMGGAGQPGTQFIAVEKNKEIGNIYGPVFDKVAPNGFQIFKDLNGDGTINIEKSFIDPRLDLAVLGNGNPDHEIGWNNQLNVAGWDINAFFRGAFGHNLVNGMRMFHEGFTPVYYNHVSTPLKIEGLKTDPKLSSAFIEKADFIKLDNLTISKKISLAKSKIKDLKISLTGQNLFTISGYRGADPEPSLIDFGPKENFNLGIILNQGTMLAPGIDHKINYLPSRTILLGVSLSL